MSPKIDLSGWPNIEQVAAATGISRRTLERELAAGKWQTQKRPRQGAKPETVFDPDQVAARMPANPSSVVKAPVTANDSANPATMAEAAIEGGVSLSAIAQIVSMVCEQFMGMMVPESPEVLAESRCRFVALEDASEITGLSAGCIRRLALEGKLTYAMDRNGHGDYRVMKIRRADLETFR